MFGRAVAALLKARSQFQGEIQSNCVNRVIVWKLQRKKNQQLIGKQPARDFVFYAQNSKIGFAIYVDQKFTTHTHKHMNQPIERTTMVCVSNKFAHPVCVSTLQWIVQFHWCLHREHTKHRDFFYSFIMCKRDKMTMFLFHCSQWFLNHLRP